MRRLWTSQRKSASSSIANKATACLILISFADFEYTDCNYKYTQSTTIDLWNCGALRALYCDTASAMDVRVILSLNYRLKRSWTMAMFDNTFFVVGRIGTSLHDPPLSPLPQVWLCDWQTFHPDLSPGCTVEADHTDNEHIRHDAH